MEFLTIPTPIKLLGVLSRLNIWFVKDQTIALSIAVARSSTLGQLNRCTVKYRAVTFNEIQ